MITIRNLSKAYGEVRALQNLSLTAEAGKTTVLLGARDSGKTTLSDIVCGVLTPDEGMVLVDGFDITLDPMSAKRHIGYMPADTAVYRDMTPRSQLRFVGQTREINARSLNEIIEKMLVQAKLSDVANIPIRQLPPAYVQRVGLAQAIVGDIHSLVLDSPTDGLNAKQIFELREIIKELCCECATLIATDSVAEASALGDVIYLIEDGKLLGKCDAQQLAYMRTDDGRTRIVCEGEESDVRAAVEKAGCACESITAEDGYMVAVAGSKDGGAARKRLFFAFADAKLPIVEMRPMERELGDILKKFNDDPVLQEKAATEGVNT